MTEQNAPSLEEVLAIFDRRWEQFCADFQEGNTTPELRPTILPDYLQRMSFHLLGIHAAYPEFSLWWLVLKATVFGYMIKEFDWPFIEDATNEQLKRIIGDRQ